LPYQPRQQLSGSLSAADLHVVTMGDRFKGLVHPCKIYNILAIGAPFLYIGPAESHVSDLWQRDSRGIGGFSARHGDVEDVVRHIRTAALTGPIRITCNTELLLHFSSRTLLPELITILERVIEKRVGLRDDAVAVKRDKAA